jgi:hypothetical protein
MRDDLKQGTALTPEQRVRRKIAAAKSYLSRLDNERRSVLHSTREDKVEEFRRLTDKRDAQYFKFRELCQELRQYED